MAILDLTNIRSGESFAGISCIRSLTLAKTRTQKDYMYGTLMNKEKAWEFKIWDSTVVAMLRPYLEAPTGFKPLVCNISGTAGTYQGTIDYTVEVATPDNSHAVAEFLPSLDTEAIFGELSAFINENISAPWVSALMSVCSVGSEYFVGGNPSNGVSIIQLLKTAWAASGNHDAIQGGLAHHTLKMLHIAKTVLTDQPKLMEYKDLVYVGIVLHDIGKTQEIVDGNYTKNSFVSHRVMGIEYMALVKSTIVPMIGIDNYYRLLSIIVGHHDKFATPADSVWAYLIHLIDMLDTWASMFEHAKAEDTLQMSSSGDLYYRHRDTRLAF